MRVVRKNSCQGARQPVMRRAVLVMASVTSACATSNVSLAQGILPQGERLHPGRRKSAPLQRVR
jgi:hypothetical protein